MKLSMIRPRATRAKPKKKSPKRSDPAQKGKRRRKQTSCTQARKGKEEEKRRRVKESRDNLHGGQAHLYTWPPPSPLVKVAGHVRLTNKASSSHYPQIPQPSPSGDMFVSLGFGSDRGDNSS
jgi:hypothetical protein